jgi:hypothetical protein
MGAVAADPDRRRDTDPDREDGAGEPLSAHKSSFVTARVICAT